jgi:hypothetical protein
MRCIGLLLLAAIVLASDVSTAARAQSGTYVGELIFRPLRDGSRMQLVKPFKYVDSQGVSWPVPAGTNVDGASIPRALWTILGAPYTGKYREASVIHDYYCQTRSRHWKAVHRVFLDGMTASGVEPIQAKLMYLAVYRFGPRWDFDVDACFCNGCPICAQPKLKRIKSYSPVFKESDLADLRRKLEQETNDLEYLERLADYQLNTQILHR